MNPTARLFAAAVFLAAWLVLLFFGFTLHGAVHLLALAGVLVAPWRTRPSLPEESES
jgi:hypothetical protein